VHSRPLPLHYKGCGGYGVNRLGTRRGSWRCQLLGHRYSCGLTNPGYLFRRGMPNLVGSSDLSTYQEFGLRSHAALITGQLLFVPEVPYGLSREAQSDQ
jgi:hypothetical protein